MNIQVEYNRFKRFKSIKAEQEAINMLEDPYVICTYGVSNGITIFDKKDYEVLGVGVLEGKTEVFFKKYCILGFDGIYQKSRIETYEEVHQQVKKMITEFHDNRVSLIEEWQAIEQIGNGMQQFWHYLHDTYTAFFDEEIFQEFLYYMDHTILVWESQSDNNAEYEVWRYKCLLHHIKPCSARYVWDSFLMYKIIN